MAGIVVMEAAHNRPFVHDASRFRQQVAHLHAGHAGACRAKRAAKLDWGARFRVPGFVLAGTASHPQYDGGMPSALCLPAGRLRRVAVPAATTPSRPACQLSENTGGRFAVSNGEHTSCKRHVERKAPCHRPKCGLITEIARHIFRRRTKSYFDARCPERQETTLVLPLIATRAARVRDGIPLLDRSDPAGTRRGDFGQVVADGFGYG